MATYYKIKPEADGHLIVTVKGSHKLHKNELLTLAEGNKIGLFNCPDDYETVEYNQKKTVYTTEYNEKKIGWRSIPVEHRFMIEDCPHGHKHEKQKKQPVTLSQYLGKKLLKRSV